MRCPRCILLPALLALAGCGTSGRAHGRAIAIAGPHGAAAAGVRVVGGKVGNADPLPKRAATATRKVAAGAPSDAEVRRELAQAQRAGVILPSATSVESFNSGPSRLLGAAGGWAFPIQPRSVALAPDTWTEDQGIDVSTSGAACGGAAVEVAITAGTIVREGVPGFGSYAPVLRIDRGPYRGWFVYYGHAAPALVAVGAHVRAGQPIAEVGCGIVGISLGPHLEIGFTPPGGANCCPATGATASSMGALLEQLFRRSH